MCICVVCGWQKTEQKKKTTRLGVREHKPCVGPRSRFRVSDSDSDADVVGAAEAAALLVALVRVAFVDDDAKDNEGNVVVDTGTVE